MTRNTTYARSMRDDIPAINAQTGTAYTLALADAEPNALLTLSNGSAITLTVPLNAAVAFPLGSEINFAQIGAGLVTVTGENGDDDATVQPAAGGTLALTGQYSQGTLRKIAADTWLLTGDLEPAT
jgi:hypothetical protein